MNSITAEALSVKIKETNYVKRTLKPTELKLVGMASFTGLATT